MELYEEIIHALQQSSPNAFSSVSDSETIALIIEGQCYKALQQIKAIIEDDRLDDTECFMCIEQIIRALEDLGSGGGFRHDFG